MLLTKVDKTARQCRPILVALSAFVILVGAQDTVQYASLCPVFQQGVAESVSVDCALTNAAVSLARTAPAPTIGFNASTLGAGAYTLLAITFNDPSKCAAKVCAMPDLMNTTAQGAMFDLGGFVLAAPNLLVQFPAIPFNPVLSPTRDCSNIIDNTGTGVVNMMTAQIQILLQYNGVPLPDPTLQVGTIHGAGACSLAFVTTADGVLQGALTREACFSTGVEACYVESMFVFDALLPATDPPTLPPETPAPPVFTTPEPPQTTPVFTPPPATLPPGVPDPATVVPDPLATGAPQLVAPPPIVPDPAAPVVPDPAAPIVTAAPALVAPVDPVPPVDPAAPLPTAAPALLIVAPPTEAILPPLPTIAPTMTVLPEPVIIAAPFGGRRENRRRWFL